MFVSLCVAKSWDVKLHDVKPMFITFCVAKSWGKWPMFVSLCVAKTIGMCQYPFDFQNHWTSSKCSNRIPCGKACVELSCPIVFHNHGKKQQVPEWDSMWKGVCWTLMPHCVSPLEKHQVSEWDSLWKGVCAKLPYYASLCFRIDTLSRQYSELEDEFRMALQIEANRFKEVRIHRTCTRAQATFTSV